MQNKVLHVKTPVWESAPLSAAMQASVLLKMDALQPIGSFKIRGIGNFCQKAAARGATRFVAASGGNAGYAAAYTGNRLGTPVTVVVPASTPKAVRKLIELERADIVEFGENLSQAAVYAIDLAKREGAVFVHPYDHVDVWEGNETVIYELSEQTEKPDAIVLSVGGGGLLMGILQALHKVNWTDVAVYGVETEGAAAFSASFAAGRPVELESVNTVAGTLASRSSLPGLLEWKARHPVHSLLTTDKSAVSACLSFADSHRILVEPACGAALSVLFEARAELKPYRKIIAIICGGAGVSLEQLAEWKKQTGA